MQVYYIFHKPYGVLSQFTRELPGHICLKDYIDVESDVYPVGRLDRDSEGLLILTNDRSLNKKLLDPSQGHSRTYRIQVEKIPQKQDLDRIRTGGLVIRVRKKDHVCLPAEIQIQDPIPDISPRVPPIRERKQIPTCWLEIKLKEGKNRQVRKMMAAVGFPVLRLIRTSVEDLELGKLKQGELQKIERDKMYSLLRIN